MITLIKWQVGRHNQRIHKYLTSFFMRRLKNGDLLTVSMMCQEDRWPFSIFLRRRWSRETENWNITHRGLYITELYGFHNVNNTVLVYVVSATDHISDRTIAINFNRIQRLFLSYLRPPGNSVEIQRVFNLFQVRIRFPDQQLTQSQTATTVKGSQFQMSASPLITWEHL